ncbi:type II toxin-antitoxin system HicA family toxin [Candidatus Micrarchaeota archaeon]|nr:type II toxin-antitoxin system HicA family toxin [Candidatus Micrarchaeota archaeon]
MKLPVVSGKEVVAVLLKNGFEVKRQKGSHVHLINTVGEQSFHVTVPVHSNKDLNPFVFRSIARQAGFTPEEFSELFRK